MKNQIPEFLQEKIQQRTTSNTKKFPLEIKKFMIEYASYYEWPFENNLRKIFKVMRAGISNLPKCGLEGCDNNVAFNNEEQLLSGCCKAHSQKISFLEKYGVDNPMKNKTVKNKFFDSMNQKYGGNTTLQSVSLRNKFLETMNEKYGVYNALESPILLDKMYVQNMRKYGTTTPQSLPEIKNKTKFKFFEKYGCDNPMKNESIREKSKNTNLQKYGVVNPMQNSNVFEKSQKNMFKKKKYVWKTGEISYVQGYEPLVLKELEESGYKYEDVKTGPTNMPEIWYYHKDKKRRYYPDIHIPKENLIIEVKSDYTANANNEVDDLKFAAAKEMGYNFKLEIR